MYADLSGVKRALRSGGRVGILLKSRSRVSIFPVSFQVLEGNDNNPAAKFWNVLERGPV